MTEMDYNQVLATMRINLSELFPIPIVLDVTREFASTIEFNKKIFLKNKKALLLQA